MRIAFLGPPGAGKGTQAERVARRHGLVTISTGDLVRQAISNRSPDGIEARSYLQDGRLVPGSVVRRLAEQAIADVSYDGFILDGYPRTVEQAEWLDAFLERHRSPLQALVCLLVPDDIIIARLSNRRVHRTTGETFHLVEKPPPAGTSDEDIVQRLDDTPAAIARRLVQYRAETWPVMEHYRHLDELFEIDGTGTMQEVADRIERALASLEVSSC